MKRRGLFVVLVCVFIHTCILQAFASYEGEILFRDIPWLSSYTDVESSYATDLSLYYMHGDWMRNFPVDDVVFYDYAGEEFKNSDLCLSANCINYEDIDVAGYTPIDISLYFAFLPINGELTHNESDTALYAARYTFSPQNLDGMYDDLMNKLTQLYGDPDEVKEKTFWTGSVVQVNFWYGQNDTMVSLRKEPDEAFGDRLYIAYACKDGDELLSEADQATSKTLANQEESSFGGNNTSGL